MAKKKPAGPTLPASVELIDMLAAAIDGVDGYESEHGDLRYWDSVSIERARRVLESLEANPTQPH